MKPTEIQTTTIRALRGRATGAILALLLALFGAVAMGQEAAAADEPAIQVGGETALTQAEFEQEFNRAIRTLAMRQGIPFNEQTRAMFDQFRADYLNQLATQEALLREAEARGITVTDEEVQQQITQTQEALGGEEAFQQTLEELGYQNVDAYREDVREGLTTQRLIDEIRAGTQVTDEEVAAYYQENEMQFGGAALEDVRDQVRERLVNERLNEQFQNLREQYGVQVNEALLGDDAEEGM